MTTFGLTPTGFVAPAVTDIVTAINTDVLSTIDPGLDLSPTHPMGQVIGIMSEKLAEVWELMATVYSAMDPDSAEGLLLDNISAISGTRRQAATYGLVVCTMNLNAGSSVPAGSVIYVNNQPANRWQLMGLSTGIGLGFTAGAVTNSGGSSANFSGVFQCLATGPVAALAGTLTQISSTVTGWNSVTNPADATIGLAQDSDAVLRERREAEITATGSCTTSAIQAKLLQVPNVLAAFVFENVTMSTDANGVPPKSFHAIVWDGPSSLASNNAIAQTLWANKPAGISTYGALSGTAIDSQGNSQTLYFDRATQVPIYVTALTTPSTLSTAQTAAVKASLVSYAAATWNLGLSVITLPFEATCLSVAGITDVTTFWTRNAPSPFQGVNIPIGLTQIATLSSTNITVNGL